MNLLEVVCLAIFVAAINSTLWSRFAYRHHWTYWKRFTINQVTGIILFTVILLLCFQEGWIHK